MKKSNIFLIIACCLALCWTLLIGWFAASAINNYRQGKDPYFARTHQQYLESKKKIFSEPGKEVHISGDDNIILDIRPGKQLTVLANPRIWDCVCTYLKNGTPVIKFTNLRKHLYYDPITITLPDIPVLFLDNFSNVTAEGFIQKEMHIQCIRVPSFTTGNCTIGMLNLDFPRTRDQEEIWLKNSNRIDTLKAIVKGSGNIRLETAGRLCNQISLSDSMRVEATYDMMKKLSIMPGSASLRK